MDCFRHRRGHVFGAPFALQHEPDPVARLEEGRVASRLAKIGVQVGMFAPQLFDQSKEGVREIRIKLRPTPLPDFLDRRVNRPSGRVRPAVRQRIEHVRERDDPRVNRNALTRELRRITRAVPPFVVVTGDFLG